MKCSKWVLLVSCLVTAPLSANSLRFSDVAFCQHFVEFSQNVGSLFFAECHSCLDSVCFTIFLFQVSYAPVLTVDGCEFDNVACYDEDASIFFDVSHTSDATIKDTTLHNSDGYFYYSSHYMPSTIEISNVVGGTSKLYNASSDLESSEYGLFHFDSVDEVTMSKITINYTYDMSHCHYVEDIINNNIYGTIAHHYECTDPVIFMNNGGNVVMRDVQVTVNISNPYNVTLSICLEKSSFCA